MTSSEGAIPIDTENRQLLSASWLLRLARDAGYDLPQISASGASLSFGRPDGFHIEVKAATGTPWIAATASEPQEQTRIDELVRQSGAKVATVDLGGVVWYSARLEGESIAADAYFMTRMLETLGSQVRIRGWRRLGSSVLLHFHEVFPEGGEPGTGLVFAPKPIVDIHMAVPGPVAGPFTEPLAHRNAELVAAVCTFALGRPVNLPPVVKTTPAEAVPELEVRRSDQSVGTLAREGISLDIFDGLRIRAGVESVIRSHGALLSYDAAIRQAREQVAVILYVVATECLTNPLQPWKTKRLTARFIGFFEELMPSELDDLIAHGNFEQAFGITRGTRTPRALRRELLSRLYSFRSEPVHEGLSISFDGMAAIARGRGLRRALAATFAQKAILRYLESPRSSLIGHGVWPGE